MKRLTSSLAFVAAAAFAAVPSVQAAEPQEATAQQMSEIAGDYQLSDGRRLQIDFDGVDAYVQLDKRPRQQLLGKSDGRFTTFDGTITVQSRNTADAPSVDVMLRGQSVTVLR